MGMAQHSFGQCAESTADLSAVLISRVVLSSRKRSPWPGPDRALLYLWLRIHPAHTQASMPAGTDEWVPVLSREDVVINSRDYPGEGARLDTALVYELIG